MANFGTSGAIKAGRMAQRDRKGSGPVATTQGIPSFEETNFLDSSTDTRMAGPVGARALALMNDPEAQRQQQEWSAMLANSHGTNDWYGVENGLA